MKEIWGYDAQTLNIDQYIRTGIGALLEANGMTLFSLKQLLPNPEYRDKCLGQVNGPIIKDFLNDVEKLDTKKKDKIPLAH